ncbi:MAG: glycosyltransferase family 2 protein [Simplicispira sp.]|nr:glycosyltransferase family 2 protein [Simplicispira sp.]
MNVVAEPIKATPWLSVLVPAYNAAAYLGECVESVLAQGIEGVELVVVDDCSNDASAAILTQLATRWPMGFRVQRHARNRGLSSARNTLLEAARGEYLWFLDADDKLLPGVLGELRDIVQTDAPDLVLCDFEVLRERRQIKHWLRGEHHRKSFAGAPGPLHGDTAQLLSGMLLAGQLHAWSKVSRRTLWDSGLRFPPGQYFEDMATMSLLALAADSSYYVPRPWVAYRQHEHSILANANWQKAQDQSRALVPLREALRSHASARSPELRLALAHQSARNLMGAMRYLDSQSSALAFAGPLPVLADQLRQNFRESSPLTEQELANAYLRRGWLLRRQKFLRWYGAYRA